MESANTPDKLALLLKNSGISDAAIKIIKEHEISGEEFLALSHAVNRLEWHFWKYKCTYDNMRDKSILFLLVGGDCREQD